MPQDIGIALNQAVHGLEMLDLEMKQDNVILIIMLQSNAMVVRQMHFYH